MRLTAKERILLHLLECGGSGEEAEVSPDRSQEGLARGAGIQRRHVAQFVRPLIREGLVRERMAHVAGARQRRKVYELTFPGRASALRLREGLKAERVRIRDGDAEFEGTLQAALPAVGGGTTLLGAARKAEEAVYVNFNAPRHDAASDFLDFTHDAPRVRVFVGRREELAELVREDRGPRIFVLRGIAGIGKSTLAAKACELVRGRRNLFWHPVRPWETSQTLLASLGRFLEALDRPGLAAVLKRGALELVPEILRQDLPDTHGFLVFDDAHEASPEAAAAYRMLADAVGSAEDVRILFLTRRSLRFYNRRDVVVDRRVREIELGGLDSEDAAALLGAGGIPVGPPNLGRRLAGHPLYLELVRAYHPRTSRALVDVRRFVEETIYTDLPAAERTILKAGCLYRVPVPKEALLSSPGTSYDDFLALADQSLIRAVGDDRYELHDTIRDFFVGTLTPAERPRLAAFATGELRGLAARASAEEDWLAAVAFLSNALSLAESPGDRRSLHESLGDASVRLGDLMALSTSYRAAMTLTSEPETLTRLHRKLASALTSRGLLDAALKEIDAGFLALGDRTSVERGWLHLLRAEFAREANGAAQTEAEAVEALWVFEAFGERLGKARALHIAGWAATWTATVSEEGRPLSERRFEEALALAQTLGEARLEADIRLSIVAAIGYASSDREAGMAHLRAVQASPAMSDPYIGARLHGIRAWFLLRFGEDGAAVEADLREARRIAGKIHDYWRLADTTYQFGIIAVDQGRYEDGGRLYEEAGREMARMGATGFAAACQTGAATAYLAAGDCEGYRRAAAVLENPAIRRGLEEDVLGSLSFRGLQAAIRGDVLETDRLFSEAFRRAGELPTGSTWLKMRVWVSHFRYGIALRSLGRDREADHQRRLAIAAARATRSPQYIRAAESRWGDRIAETMRRCREGA